MSALRSSVTRLLNTTIWLTAAAAGRRPRLGALHGGVGAGRMQHSEWDALLKRFARDGLIEYGTMTRVRRLVEIYLSRLAEENPETFVDTDDQIAFYLNAYNAIAIHQVLLHYPIRSIRDVPTAFVRPYPIGRRNLSLQVLYASVLRSFGDPRIHAAISTTALGSPPIRSEAFTGSRLQQQLDTSLREFLADQMRGAFYDPQSNVLYLGSTLRWIGGDFVAPEQMPSLRSLATTYFRPAALLDALRPHLPVEIAVAIEAESPSIRFLPSNWTLNERQAVASGSTIRAL